MIINDPNKTSEQIIREYYERKKQEKAAGIKDNAGNGAANPSDAPKIISAGNYIKLENIVCVDANGKAFESYPELYVANDIIRNQDKSQVNKTPYQWIAYHEQNGLFLPSFALTCNILAELYKNKSDSEENKLLIQYKDKGNGNGWHAQNTIINWGAKQIIHSPLDSDFPSDGGTSGINNQKRVMFGFDNKEFSDKTLEEVLKIPNFARYVKNLTGLQNPSILVDIGNYFGKTARVWVSSGNETRACWLGCLSGDFLLGSDGILDSDDASRGVRKNFP